MKFGRGERIRTSGLYVPNVALYQAKLHPEKSAKTRGFYLKPRGFYLKPSGFTSNPEVLSQWSRSSN